MEVGWRARTDLGDINQLAGSIAKHGQVQPIVVSTNGTKQYHIISGVRRLTACKQLGFQVAAMRVSPRNEQHEIELQLEENISRKGFDELELAEGLKRLKGLYEKEHPETKHGATGGGRGGKGTRTKGEKSEDDTPVDRFTLKAAHALGCGETKVKEYLQMAELPKRQKDQINKADTRTERNKRVRQALREVRVERKKEKLEEKAKALLAEREEAQEEGSRVVLKMCDNKTYFAEAQPETIELCLTDPPYGQRSSLISHALRGDIDSHFGAWDTLDVGWVFRVAPLLVKGGQILTFSPLEAVGEYKLVCEAAGLTWRGAIVWHRSNPGVAHRSVYLSAVEAICWATKGDGYVFQPWENAGGEDVHNVITGPVCQGSERLNHPNQKPLWLLQRLLERHTNAHSRVLDPFCGVGSTLVVCKQLGLPAVGIERDEGFVHQARLRLQAM